MIEITGMRNFWMLITSVWDKIELNVNLQERLLDSFKGQ